MKNSNLQSQCTSDNKGMEVDPLQQELEDLSKLSTSELARMFFKELKELREILRSPETNPLSSADQALTEQH